jgi:nitroimidazol reductase NimA-like FMN-containing flavoprotein (pyridoxamine 5'-phosphate oxidase superfamily)
MSTKTPVTQLPPSERTRVKRLPARAAYERATIDAILDEGLVCHVGFTIEAQPFVIPTAYARVGDALFVHGSAASRMLRGLASGLPACVTVTLIDGLVLARSAFHQSMNYRSVVILGVATLVSEPEEKLAALEAIVNHLIPGRWSEVRPPNEQELKATSVLRIPLAEASAKIRTGGPLDDAEDMALPCWAGVLPLRLAASAPIAEPGLGPGRPLPEAVRHWAAVGPGWSAG